MFAADNAGSLGSGQESKRKKYRACHGGIKNVHARITDVGFFFGQLVFAM